MRFSKLHLQFTQQIGWLHLNYAIVILLPEIFQFAQENTNSHGKFFKADVLHIFKSH